MKVNIENAVNQASRCMEGDYAKGYAYTLKEFVNNLKEVKQLHLKGESKQALDEFFNLYVFNKKLLGRGNDDQ
ncbi:hypothetical protein A2Z67_03770 [Candidatus Woesebacteria bacterium RBG_13_36_22]|uniref:Uncharacterized protein n=1 Tax=Candidatus Woesebacteria bacterium RBG_13_36_22 TaxID=1802478 RepID=A0A1F7X459_9BACT|nr:MAG: hypothetical protein A2Z67_03770 [Candidatus Woesebacteria bacterium RBG_13_36_22]